MSNFPLIRHKNFEAWVPTTDIDEVDAKTGVLTDIFNVDFKNGYIETTTKPVIETLPSFVPTDIFNGYGLLSMKSFHHSTQGDKGVYILWKDDEFGKDLKIYVDGSILLNLDEQNSDIVFLEKPNNINYNLVNDELKINLNCLASYNSINEGAEDTLLNLTLVYLEAVDYDVDNNINRAEGWYCYPRWLGWQIPNDLFETSVASPSTVFEDFDETDYILSRFRVNNMVRGGTTDNYIQLNQPSVRYCDFHFGNTYGYTFAIILDVDITHILGSRNTTMNVFVGGVSIGQFVIDTQDARQKYTAVVPVENRDLNQTVKVTFSTTGQNRPFVYNVELQYIDTNVSGIVVGQYVNGQRGLLSKLFVANGSTAQLIIPVSLIDWRIIAYEIYVPNNVTGIYVLVDKKLVQEGHWQYDVGDNIVRSISRASVAGFPTLNKNYNLPEDTRVDNQKLIYQEASHKGRVYFVNEDFKVYQSHILSNLAIQADSFPFDEDVGFGYFIVDQSRINKGIATTPTNYLAILTDAGLYVYFIQPSNSGVFKILRLTSGSIGLSSRNSIARSLTGDPATDGLLWIDYNGVYLYVGDSQPPKNLILGTHEEYWRQKSNTEKDNAIGFYNPLKREYWLQIGDDIMVFEISYNKWKKFEFGSGVFLVSEFYGIVDNILYYRSGNTFVKYDVSVEEYPYFQIDTAYNTTNNVSEIYDKILQELYIIFGDSGAGVVYMQVWVDDRQLDEVYEFNPSNRYDVFLAPLAIRFNRIKFRLFRSQNGNKIRIKEFGCSYSEDNKEMLGNTAIERDALAEAPSGYGFDYGQNYGG